MAGKGKGAGGGAQKGSFFAPRRCAARDVPGSRGLFSLFLSSRKDNPL